jgi:transposase-like protein
MAQGVNSTELAIVDIEVLELGIALDHLVRPINDDDVKVLADTDASEWDPIEVRVWPDEWPKPYPNVKYHVISGNHRTSAALIKGLATLNGRIIDAPDDLSYTIAAVKSNTRHGRNFTQEERLDLANKMHDQGLSLAEIAKTFGVHKSTVGNWLSGRDSNASRKKTEQQPETVAYATPITPNKLTGKMLGWIASAPIEIESDKASDALSQLPPALQEKARSIHQWLSSVLATEV